MAYDNTMAHQVRNALATANAGQIKEMPMFGSLGFMINGKLVICVRESGVMYKLGPELAAKLAADGRGELMSMGNRTMRGWLVASNRHLRETDSFQVLLKLALNVSSF